MQKTEVIIRIGSDAKVNESQNGNTVINFDGAATERWKDKQGNKQEKTTWYKCSWWVNNTSIAQYLKKGTHVYVNGKPNASAYQNKEGEVVVQNGILVREVELLSSNNNGSNHPENTDSTEDKDDLPF